MADGRLREMTEFPFSEFRAQIVDLELSFKPAVIGDVLGDVYPGHDFLVEQQVTW